MIDSATLIEVFDFAAGIFVMVLAIYASRKFRFVVFKFGWYVVAVSGAIAAAASVFRVYYTYAHIYEGCGVKEKKIEYVRTQSGINGAGSYRGRKCIGGSDT